MARARNIKPGFFRDAALVELPIETRLLFPGLWTLADRAGRLEDKPKQIKMEIYPADNFDVEAMLDQLAGAGLIVRYEADGKRFIQVTNFEKHQNPHRDEKPSTIPAPCKHGASIVPTCCENGVNRADSFNLSPDSFNLSPEKSQQPISDQPAEVETLLPAQPKAASKVGQGFRLPEDWKLPRDLGEWALREKPGWTPDDVRRCAEKFSDHWRAQPGAKGRKTDWQATWRNWVRNEQGPPARASPQLDARSADRKRAVEELIGVKPRGIEHERIEREINPTQQRIADGVGG